MKIVVHHKGRRKTYRVKEAGDLTLQDWKNLTPLDLSEKVWQDATVQEDSPIVQILLRHTGMPVEVLREAVAVGEAEALIDAIASTLTEAITWHQAHKDEKTPDGWEAPKIYTFGKRRLLVPHDIEMETVAGQWFDLSGIEGGHEADQMAHTLAILLRDEGQDYAGTAGRVEAFMAFPLRDAFALDAFFFGRSERYRNAIAALSRRSATWTARQAVMELRRSLLATEG